MKILLLPKYLFSFPPFWHHLYLLVISMSLKLSEVLIGCLPMWDQRMWVLGMIHLMLLLWAFISWDYLVGSLKNVQPLKLSSLPGKWKVFQKRKVLYLCYSSWLIMHDLTFSTFYSTCLIKHGFKFPTWFLIRYIYHFPASFQEVKMGRWFGL